MRKIIAVVVLVGGTVSLSSASANALTDLPPASTYEQCIKNGRALGYSAADVETKCLCLFHRERMTGSGRCGRH
jgi:hypothetical protein